MLAAGDGDGAGEAHHTSAIGAPSCLCGLRTEEPVSSEIIRDEVDTVRGWGPRVRGRWYSTIVVEGEKRTVARTLAGSLSAVSKLFCNVNAGHFFYRIFQTLQHLQIVAPLYPQKTSNLSSKRFCILLFENFGFVRNSCMVC